MKVKYKPCCIIQERINVRNKKIEELERELKIIYNELGVFVCPGTEVLGCVRHSEIGNAILKLKDLKGGDDK